MTAPGPFELASETLGPLPIVNHFFDRVDTWPNTSSHLPHNDRVELDNIPLYPELRACPAPSAPRILEILNGVARHHLTGQSHIIQTFEPTLTPLQHRVLDLLGIPTNTYTNTAEP